MPYEIPTRASHPLTPRAIPLAFHPLHRGKVVPGAKAASVFPANPKICPPNNLSGSQPNCVLVCVFVFVLVCVCFCFVFVFLVVVVFVIVFAFVFVVVPVFSVCFSFYFCIF